MGSKVQVPCPDLLIGIFCGKIPSIVSRIRKKHFHFEKGEKMFGRYLFLASGLLGIALLASGSWLGWIFLLATALIILWLTNVIQRFWLELVGFSLLLVRKIWMLFSIGTHEFKATCRFKKQKMNPSKWPFFFILTYQKFAVKPHLKRVGDTEWKMSKN